MNTFMTLTKIDLTNHLLQGMTRKELRSVAKVSNVPRGRNRQDTVNNLATAIVSGNLHVKFVASIQLPPVSPHGFGKVLFMKKLRTYKPDKVLSPLPV